MNANRTYEERKLAYAHNWVDWNRKGIVHWFKTGREMGMDPATAIATGIKFNHPPSCFGVAQDTDLVLKVARQLKIIPDTDDPAPMPSVMAIMTNNVTLTVT